MRSIPRTAQSIGEYKPKPFIFPPEMCVIQDTREQTPLFGTRLPKGLVLCSATLRDGDYSLRGFTDKFAIERKGISDLLSYVTTERERTKAKMERFKRMEWVGLVIEAKESELYRPYLHSTVSPEVVRQSLISFQVRYGVHVYINSRENLSRYVLDIMIKYYRIKKEL